jgi:hypothetical protein
MHRDPVTSSLIKSTGHDPATGTMEVEFTDGKVYRYEGVPAEVHDTMRSAESVGRAFLRAVKPAFEGIPVDEKKEGES